MVLTVRERFLPEMIEKEAYAGVRYYAVPREKTRSIDPDSVQELIECGKKFSRWGWAPAYNDSGSSGNLGFRDGDAVAVTATNKNLGNLVPDDVIRVTGVDYITDPPTVYHEASGDRKPTSEVLAYDQLFKMYPDISVVLHGHDNFTTERAKAIVTHFQKFVSMTEIKRPYGTKEFAFDLGNCGGNDDRYLIARGHGFFALGHTFDEALFYAKRVHDLTRIGSTTYGRLGSIIEPPAVVDKLVILASNLVGANIIKRMGESSIGRKIGMAVYS